MVELIDYNVYLTPIRDLPCLEDVIQKGYSTDDEQNKTVSITIREYPASMPYGIESLIDSGQSNYFTVIQRHAVLYAVSILESQIKEISSACKLLSRTGSSLDLDMKLYNGCGIPYKTRPKLDMTCVYMPFWCKEWIQSNCRYLNLSSGKLAVYLVLVALNKSSTQNQHIKDEIQDEVSWFLKYLDDRYHNITIL